MKVLIKNALLEFLTQTSFHGLPNILKSNRIFHKFMWFIFFLLSFTTCLYSEYICVVSFLEYRAVTELKTIFEQPSLFPAVSFCSRDETYFNNKSLQSLIKECKFNYDLSCNFSHGKYFELFYDSYGNQCYMFNSGKNLHIGESTIGGRDDSFLLKIKAPKGLHIWVHNQSSPPELINNNDIYGNMILLGVKRETQLVIERIFDSKLEYPYNDCLKDVRNFQKNKTLIDFIINNKNKSYKYELCIKYCFELFYLESHECNCSNTSLGNVYKNCYEHESYLTNKDEFIWLLRNQFYQDNLDEKCSIYCPFECDTIEYLVDVNSVDIDESDVVLLVAYYRHLKYTISRQIPKMKFTELISNIGGIIGLFLGSSFICFIELIQIVSEILFIFFEHK